MAKKSNRLFTKKTWLKIGATLFCGIGIGGLTIATMLFWYCAFSGLDVNSPAFFGGLISFFGVLILLFKLWKIIHR